MGATVENRRSGKVTARPLSATVLAHLERLLARVSAVSPAVGFVVLGTMAVAICLAIYATGGTKGGLPHLFYLPVILAALIFGMRGALTSAVAAGILCGVLPVSTAASEPQTLAAILVRGVMFVVVACVAAASISAHQKADHERVSRDLRAAIVGSVTESKDVDLSLVPLIDGVVDGRTFHPVFQPIYSLDDGHLIAVEALTRFDSPPQHAPDVWFLAAEHAGRGTELELAAIEEAIAATSELPQQVDLWINLSPATVSESRLRELIDSCGERRVAIELTEHAIVADYGALSDCLTALRESGVQLAVDDAGAGFASLRHIVRLAPDITKLDISLTQDLAGSPVRRALGEAMISFVQGTGGILVVEGIEEAADLSAWTSLGADAGQGFLLGRPGPLPAARTSAALNELLGFPSRRGQPTSSAVPSQRSGSVRARGRLVDSESDARAVVAARDPARRILDGEVENREVADAVRVAYERVQVRRARGAR